MSSRGGGLPRFCLACALLTTPAAAQDAVPPSGEGYRTELIQLAGTQRQARRFDEALRTARAAQVIRSTPSLRAFITEILLERQEVQAAFEEATRCLDDLRADRTINHWQALQRSCADLLARCETEGAWLQVDVLDPLPRAVVTVDGAALPRGEWGMRRARAPGVVTVEGEAPGRAPFRREVALRAGETSRVAVAMVTATRAPERRRPGEDARAPDGGGAANLLGPVVMFSAAGLAAASGAVLLAVGQGYLASRDELCVGEGETCGVLTDAARAQATDLQDSARTLHVAGVTSLVLGGALAAGGVVWLVVQRRAPRASTASTAHPLAIPSNGGLLLGLSGAL